MSTDTVGEPDSTAVRVALWRAMHVAVDAMPAVFEDEVGLRLIAPREGWRDRPDMDAVATRGLRAAMAARARFVEDLVTERAARGVGQYVLLGAGLDTFVQRRPDVGSRLRVFEVEQRETLEWKRRRLVELGYGVPDRLRMVPVDFQAGEPWWDRLVDAGFDADRPAVVVSTGVTMYLTKDVTRAVLRRVAGLAPGSTLAMTFILPAELLDEADRPVLETSADGARAAGTPFVSLYAPDEMLAMARDTGFADARHVPGSELDERYFSDRQDGLHPARGEDFLVATT